MVEWVEERATTRKSGQLEAAGTPERVAGGGGEIVEI
jgi:hypothetical protein